MWNKSLQSLFVSMIVAAGVSLSACNSSTQEANPETDTTVTTEQTVPEPTTADAEDVAVVEGVPLSYNVSTWNNDAVDPINVDELNSIQATFGDVVTTDENSLDYASNLATKYRFMASDAPYLDIIDSQRYLELGWYYANPTDSDAEKEQSLAHAQKAYTLARQLMGDEGGEIVSDMLSRQIIKNQTVGGQKVELAKCEFYSCMLVLNKSAAQMSSN